MRLKIIRNCLCVYNVNNNSFFDNTFKYNSRLKERSGFLDCKFRVLNFFVILLNFGNYCLSLSIL